jgi:hypothetical protein
MILIKLRKELQMTTLEQELITLLVFIVIAFVSYVLLRLHVRLQSMESDSVRNKKDIEYLSDKILELRK